jgi:SAM-dependent methyltransferase
MQEQQTTSPAQMYEEYFGPAIFTPWARVLLEHAAPSAGARALDLACGTGIVARQLAPRVGPTGHVLGLDLNPDMLAVAQSLPAPEGAAIEWRQGDAVDPDLPDAGFDLVVCQQGFQFFPDRAKAAGHMRRVLADGGRATVAVWKGLDHHPLFRALFEAEARQFGEPLAKVAIPFSIDDAEELHTVFREAGFPRVTVASETRPVRFPSPDRFVKLTVLAGAAVLPAFKDMDAEARDALVEAILREVDDVVERYIDGDHVAFPMTSHVCVAEAS